VIVFDHHQAPEVLPKTAALVDPNREDDLSGLGYLCAAGVVFMALVALNRALREAGFWNGGKGPDLLASLDLVALATVADVVPLIGLNRAFVLKGLAIMRERRRPGLAALFDVGGADGPPRPYHLGFVIGPRINAGGRIGDAALGVRLLTATDDIEAIAIELDRLNRMRQLIEIEALAEAEAEALLSLGLEERGAAVVVAGERWPPGVVGLLAARLKERFERPAFALTLAGCHATGSGRSIVGVDLGRAVRAAVEAGVAIKGGGHAMAAGVTLATERLGDWRAFLEERLGQAVTKARAEAGLKVDAALTANAATPELVHRLEAAGPYGAGAPEPLFALPRHRLAEVTPVGVEGRHLRLRAVAGDGRAVEGIAFRASGKKLGEALTRLKGAPVHLAGTLSVNRFGGRERAQIRVVDVAEAT
jgi:single-stranded-DNA-specific exonuclease